MGKNFYKYLKDKRSVMLVAVALALGLILIFLGSGDEKSPELGIEERLAVACSGVEGVGECSVLVYYSSEAGKNDGAVESVIVICDGADDVRVRLRLTEMLSSFFGIGSNRIRIEKRADLSALGILSHIRA